MNHEALQKPGRILAVDDEPIWRDILKELLKQYHVDTASSIKEALQRLKTEVPYQVLVTDVGLSRDENNTDGIDLLKALPTLSPTTRAIAVSGRAAIANQEQFKEQYHALAYFERDILYSDDVQQFLDTVALGVRLSQQSAIKE